MTGAYLAGLVLYAAILLVAGGIAIVGLSSSLLNLSNEYFAVTLERGGTSVALLSLTVAYAVALSKRGLWFAAPFIFAVSYAVLGVTLSFWLRAMGKGFAPASVEEALVAYVEGAVFIAAVAALAVAGWIWVWRSSWWSGITPRSSGRS